MNKTQHAIKKAESAAPPRHTLNITPISPDREEAPIGTDEEAMDPAVGEALAEEKKDERQDWSEPAETKNGSETALNEKAGTDAPMMYHPGGTLTDDHVKLLMRVSMFLPMLIVMILEATPLLGNVKDGDGTGSLCETPLFVTLRLIVPRGPVYNQKIPMGWQETGRKLSQSMKERDGDGDALEALLVLVAGKLTFRARFTITRHHLLTLSYYVNPVSG